MLKIFSRKSKNRIPEISMKRVEKLYKLKRHAANPRIIKDTRYKKLLKSLKDFPEMLEARPLVCNTDLEVIGGNQRLAALRELGYKEYEIEVVDWSEDKQKEFMIKDNTASGDWDMDIIANEWNMEDLEDWGFDLPNHVFKNESLDLNKEKKEEQLKCEYCGR